MAGRGRVVNLLAGPVAGQRSFFVNIGLGSDAPFCLQLDRSGRGSESLSESVNIGLTNAKGDWCCTDARELFGRGRHRPERTGRIVL